MKKNKENINIRFLGVDWGEARIGLALGDSDTKLAIPYKTVSGLAEVLQVAREEGVEKIIVGKPVKMSGSQENLTEGFCDFIKLLEKEAEIKIEYIDERLTSKAADALIGDKKTKAGRDEIAAMLILQTYFDKS